MTLTSSFLKIKLGRHLMTPFWSSLTVFMKVSDMYWQVLSWWAACWECRLQEKKQRSQKKCIFFRLATSEANLKDIDLLLLSFIKEIPSSRPVPGQLRPTTQSQGKECTDPKWNLTLQPSPLSLLWAWSQAGALSCLEPGGHFGEAKQNMLLSLHNSFFKSFYYFRERKGRPYHNKSYWQKFEMVSS